MLGAYRPYSSVSGEEPKVAFAFQLADLDRDGLVNRVESGRAASSLVAPG